MVKLFLPSTGLVRDDNCLDWNRNKNNTTSVHYRRLALQREADVYIAPFVLGHDSLNPRKCNTEVDKTMFYDVCVHKSDRLDVQCMFRMKTEKEKDF